MAYVRVCNSQLVGLLRWAVNNVSAHTNIHHTHLSLARSLALSLSVLLTLSIVGGSLCFIYNEDSSHAACPAAPREHSLTHTPINYVCIFTRVFASCAPFPSVFYVKYALTGTLLSEPVYTTCAHFGTDNYICDAVIATVHTAARVRYNMVDGIAMRFRMVEALAPDERDDGFDPFVLL